MMKITQEFVKLISKPPRGVRIKFEEEIETLLIRPSRPVVRIKRLIECVWVVVLAIGAILEWRYRILFIFWSWLMKDLECLQEVSIHRTYFCFLSICLSVWAVCLLIANAIFRPTLEISADGIILRGARIQRWNISGGKSIKVTNLLRHPIWGINKRKVEKQSEDIQKVIANIPSLTDKECVWLNEVLDSVKTKSS